MTTYQRKLLLSTSAGIALENMDIMFLAFSLSSMITSFHISGTQAGFISTITNLGMLIGGIFFGIIADKYGRVKVFSQTVLLFSIASLLMYFASNIYLVYLFRF
ncbi:TPA: MFS transporter, partial [Enterococcus faecium]|nr:MFS transporter [Enterococcus faecium]